MYTSTISRFLGVFALMFTLVSCSSDDASRQRNPFLNERSFSFELNLNLPENDPIRFIGGTVYVPQGGIRGVLVHRTSQSQMVAWEASCPNHNPNACSTMNIDGAMAICSCEDYTYSLSLGLPFTEPGEGETLYPMLQYGAQFDGNTVFVSN